MSYAARLCTALALVLVSFASSARADVIAMPPASCVPGSAPRDFCHGPPTCDILSCRTDADCAPSQACVDRDLCIRQHCCSGRGCGLPDAVNIDHVDGECGDGTCGGFDTTCEKRSVCVTGPRVDAGTPDGGVADGGVADGGVADGGVADGGVADGGPRDSGTVADSGAIDSGAIDSGAIDSGVDSGAGGPSGSGGCCSVTRPGSAVGGALFALLLGFVLLRRSRR